MQGAGANGGAQKTDGPKVAARVARPTLAMPMGCFGELEGGASLRSSVSEVAYHTDGPGILVRSFFIDFKFRSRGFGLARRATARMITAHVRLSWALGVCLATERRGVLALPIVGVQDPAGIVAVRESAEPHRRGRKRAHKSVARRWVRWTCVAPSSYLMLRNACK